MITFICIYSTMCLIIGGLTLWHYLTHEGKPKKKPK